jgi:hypothetical protein
MMKIIVRIVLILGALLAIRLLPKAFRQEAQALELITALFQMILMTAANTAKVQAVQAQVIETAAAASTAATAAASAATAAASAATAAANSAQHGDDTSTNGIANGNINGYSGPQIGGASAHYHGGSGNGNQMQVADGTHDHSI